MIELALDGRRELSSTLPQTVDFFFKNKTSIRLNFLFYRKIRGQPFSRDLLQFGDVVLVRLDLLTKGEILFEDSVDEFWRTPDSRLIIGRRRSDSNLLVHLSGAAITIVNRDAAAIGPVARLFTVVISTA